MSEHPQGSPDGCGCLAFAGVKFCEDHGGVRCAWSRCQRVLEPEYAAKYPYCPDHLRRALA